MGYNCRVAVNISKRLLNEHGQFTSPSLKIKENALPACMIFLTCV